MTLWTCMELESSPLLGKLRPGVSQRVRGGFATQHSAWSHAPSCFLPLNERHANHGSGGSEPGAVRARGPCVCPARV